MFFCFSPKWELKIEKMEKECRGIAWEVFRRIARKKGNSIFVKIGEFDIIPSQCFGSGVILCPV